MEYWERLVLEFFGNEMSACSLRLNVECATGPLLPCSIDVPRCLLARWFWLWVQNGLVRLSIQVERLNETLMAGSQILVSSPAIRLTSCLATGVGGLVLVEHLGVTLMRFSSTGRLLQWDLTLRSQQEFFSQTHHLLFPHQAVEPLEIQRISGFPRPFYFYQEMIQVIDEMLPLRETTLETLAVGGRSQRQRTKRSSRR